MDIYYIDDAFVTEDKATLSVKDLTVLRGFGVFDFLVTYNKRPFHLKEHVRRLVISAEKIGLALNHSNDAIYRIVNETVQRNTHHKESKIRIIYTGGISSDGLTPAGNGKLMVMVTPREDQPGKWYTDGAKIITLDTERFIPGAKSTNYLTAVWALEQAHHQGAIEAVYVDRNHHMLEGTTTNFYFFKDNKLITPPGDILPGITRRIVLDLVKDHFEVELRDIDIDEIDTMEEVFISASNKEIVPIVRINETVINGGKPGANSRKVMQLFKNYTATYSQEND